VAGDDGKALRATAFCGRPQSWSWQAAASSLVVAGSVDAVASGRRQPRAADIGTSRRQGRLAAVGDQRQELGGEGQRWCTDGMVLVLVFLAWL
jgi:hypothetical protein